MDIDDDEVVELRNVAQIPQADYLRQPPGRSMSMGGQIGDEDGPGVENAAFKSPVNPQLNRCQSESSLQMNSTRRTL